jgi:hypothetical protein
MGYLYFPKAVNLIPLDDAAVSAIDEALKLLAGKTPYKFLYPIPDYKFYTDKGMTTETGILGYTGYFSHKVLLAPSLMGQFVWKDMNGIPNNETAMGTVIHELTHLHQMEWLFGLAWPIMNIPGLDMIIESQARQNGEAAIEILGNIYEERRKAARIS